MAATVDERFQRGYEFDAMARRPMYGICPSWLLERCHVTENSSLADIGCGSGIFTRYVLERFPDAPGPRILAIDPSEFELAIMRSLVDDERVTFVQGRAQEAAEISGQVDAAVLCNVLHLIPLSERRSVLDGVFELVRPGGTVGANTLFYDGGIDPHTQTFYTLWMAHAREYLRRHAMTMEKPKDTPIALQRLSPEEHRALFESCGFTDVEVEEVETTWTTDDWEALSHYSVFIQGALGPEIDLAIGNAALVEGIRAAYNDLDISTITRGWLHCAARRP